MPVTIPKDIYEQEGFSAPTSDKVTIPEDLVQRVVNETRGSRVPRAPTVVGTRPMDLKSLVDVGGVAEGSGAIMGGMYGAMAGGPLGSVIGGALGAMGGRTFSNMLEGKAMPTQLKEAVRAGYDDFKWSVGLGVVGKGISGISNKLLGSNASKSAELLKEAERLNIPAGLISVSDNALVRGIPKVTGIIPLGAAPSRIKIKKGKAVAEERLGDFLDEVAPNMSLQQIGVDMYQAAKNANQAFFKTAGHLYNAFFKVSDILGNPAVFPSSHLKNAVELLELDMKEGARVGQEVSPKLRALMAEIKDLPEGLLTPTQIREYQVRINRIARTQKGKTAGAVAPFKQALETTFNNPDPSIAKAMRPEDYDLLVGTLRAANDFYAAGMIKYNNATAQKFQRLVDKNLFSSVPFKKAGTIEPDMLGYAFYKSKSIEGVRSLRELVGGENVAKMGAARMREALESSKSFTAGKGDVLSFHALEDRLNLNNPEGREVLREYFRFSPVNFNDVLKVIEIGKSIDEVAIADAATMIARRLTLGGSMVIQGGIAASGGAGGVAAFNAGALVFSAAINGAISSKTMAKGVRLASELMQKPNAQITALQLNRVIQFLDEFEDPSTLEELGIPTQPKAEPQSTPERRGML